MDIANVEIAGDANFWQRPSELGVGELVARGERLNGGLLLLDGEGVPGSPFAMTLAAAPQEIALAGWGVGILLLAIARSTKRSA